MDPMQIFWLFFMLAALQPAITQRAGGVAEAIDRPN
jgi:hypothetical protein